MHMCTQLSIWKLKHTQIAKSDRDSMIQLQHIKCILCRVYNRDKKNVLQKGAF